MITKKPRFLPTGCPALDGLLDGGLPIGEITLAYGESSSGKTTLALQAAFRAAASSWKVIYVDADRSFTPQRFTQIAGPASDEASSNIFIFAPTSFQEQARVIEGLENYLSKLTILVVVDSITSLYRIASTAPRDRFLLNRALNRQLAYLAELARKHGLAVLITSQVHASLEREEVEPVAKRALFFWSRNVIKLRPLGKSMVKASVERLAFKESSGLERKLRLTEGGFEGAA